MKNENIIVEKVRGNIVESLLRGHAVLTDISGDVKWSLGNPNYFTFIRSASKPFQAIPVITTGAYKKFGLEPKHLAVISGSHNGQKIHQQTVLEILKKSEFSEEDLQCGVHPPYSKSAIAEIGKNYRPLSHTCSGKHAGMLAICKYMEWDISDYTNVNHPVQQLMRDTVAKITNMKSEDLAIGIDGCGVPVFGMPIKNMAVGFARLNDSENLPVELKEVTKTIVNALQKNPVIYAGEDRVATMFVVDNPDKIFKAGAEGVGCFGLEKLGLAFKFECGESSEVFRFATAHFAKLLECKLDKLAQYLKIEIKANNGTVAGEAQFKIDNLKL